MTQREIDAMAKIVAFIAGALVALALGLGLGYMRHLDERAEAEFAQRQEIAHRDQVDAFERLDATAREMVAYEDIKNQPRGSNE